MKRESVNHSPISVSGLRIGYRIKGEMRQLSGRLNFSLSQGSLNAVVGVNGVGKSTLLRTLTGMQAPLEGTIEIDGYTLESISPTKRAQLLSVVLTEPIASKNLSVAELVSLGRHPYTNWLGQLSEQDQTLINACLTKMELEEIRDQPCHTLSDGQLQRALIARALAQDTPLMILDEPTTHLDLYHRVKILKLLREISHGTGRTILFSTHEIDLAIQLCDHILVIQPGKADFGSPCELIDSGDFERLFPRDTIRFDPDHGMFRVHK